MRTVDYEEWKRNKQAWSAIRIKVENSLPGKVAGRRPRDPDKERLLIRLDKARMRKYIESGKLEILGPRCWKWRIDFPKKTDN